MAAYSLAMCPKSALSTGKFLTCPAMQNWKHSREPGPWQSQGSGVVQPHSAQLLDGGLVVLLSSALPCGKSCPQQMPPPSGH